MMLDRRTFLSSAALGGLAASLPLARSGVAMAGNGLASEAMEPRHGLAMHGSPALPAGAPFPYTSSTARKGGRIVLALQGTFDSLNPYAVRGVAPDAGPKFVWQGMMLRSLDEPFSIYCLLAEAVEMPRDRTSATFHLRREARFADGRPLTSADVLFSFELLKAKGKPFFRSAYGRVTLAEARGPHIVHFAFGDGSDRELPLLIGTMPVFPAHATDPEAFDGTMLSAPPGSGPYRFADVKPGESILLARNPDFWAADLPLLRGLYNPDEIRYDFFRDANTMFEAFKAGLYDFRLENDPGRWIGGYDFPALREGRVIREALPNGNPKGMNAFVFNTRRPVFADVRVREALGLLFDFDWVNRNLYSGVYKRTASYFEGSDLASTGKAASPGERALLAPFPDAVRADILDGAWRPEAPDGSGRDREAARRALGLLEQAGWTLKGGALTDARGTPFAFEFVVTSRAQERLALNYQRSLLRIGVDMQVRLVDDVQYWRRLSRFEFDMIQFTWTGSLSPGGEQVNRWGSVSAGRESSLNFPGVQVPAADAAIRALLAARERGDFVDAARALDRVLLSGFYVVPLFHVPDQWIARVADVKRPDRVPLTGVALETLWRE